MSGKFISEVFHEFWAIWREKFKILNTIYYFESQIMWKNMEMLYKGFTKLRIEFLHLIQKTDFFVLELETHERVPESVWKHQKSKDLTFLHRSCLQLFFSRPNFFFVIEKKMWFFSKSEKIENFNEKS